MLLWKQECSSRCSSRCSSAHLHLCPFAPLNYPEKPWEHGNRAHMGTSLLHKGIPHDTYPVPMPRSTPRLCARCGRQVHGRCPVCSSGWANGRTGRSWRQATVNSVAWQRFREQYLHDHPMCEWDEEPCDSLSEEIDHLDGVDYSDRSQLMDPNLVRALCLRHHRLRTTRQGNAAQGRTGRGRQRRPRKRQ